MIEVTLLNSPEVITKEAIYSWIADTIYPIRGVQAKKPELTFERLLKESYGNSASRVMEYIPCKLLHMVSKNPIKYYGFGYDSHYYTTGRELFNLGHDLDTILPMIDFTHYKAVRVKAPRFVYNQLQTHTNVTSVSFSARYNDGSREYWYPAEFFKYRAQKGQSNGIYNQYQKEWNRIVENSTPIQLRSFMKDELSIPRKEVYNRGADSLEYVEFTLGSFTNHPHYWEHFLNQRAEDSHTQKETREVAQLIKKVLTK